MTCIFVLVVRLLPACILLSNGKGVIPPLLQSTTQFPLLCEVAFFVPVKSVVDFLGELQPSANVCCRDEIARMVAWEEDDVSSYYVYMDIVEGVLLVASPRTEGQLRDVNILRLQRCRRRKLTNTETKNGLKRVCFPF